MFLTRLKLASVFMLMIGGIAAGTAVVLAQSGAGSGVNRNQARAATVLDRTELSGPQTQAPIPAYISRSRAMIISRLEEEAAEAKARLDRMLRKVRSPDDPVVVRARRTVEALDELLARIDAVLVDADERYPTMFDFSNAASFTASPAERVVGEVKRVDPSNRRLEITIGSDDGNHQTTAASAQAELERAWERVEWAKQMFEKGYVSKAQLARELDNYRHEVIKARSEGPERSQSNAAQTGQKGQQPGVESQQAGRQGEGQNKQNGFQQGGPKDQQPGNAQKNQDDNAAAQPGQPQNEQPQARQNQPQVQPGRGRQEGGRERERSSNTYQDRDTTNEAAKP
jgi:hypothetical protein